MTIRSESPLQGGRIYDTLLQLKDAGLVAASAAATVASSAKVIDLGAGRYVGDVIIDATAVEVDTGNEIYTIMCEFSNSSSFASGIVSGAMQYLGHNTPIPGGADAVQGVGRYILPFTNLINGSQYRYMRLYTVVGGTIATGINYSAFISRTDTFPG